LEKERAIRQIKEPEEQVRKKMATRKLLKPNYVAKLMNSEKSFEKPTWASRKWRREIEHMLKLSMWCP
jgi:hypothetical protein